MSETVLAHSGAEDSPLERPRAFDTILYGGVLVGTLDALDATIFFGLRGASPSGIFQYIASGLLGRAAFSGGMKTALLGLLLHFLIAFILATIYYVASRRFSVLIRHAVVCGLLYGVVAHFVMDFVVTPMSAAPKSSSYPLAVMLNGVIGHGLVVGLPIALIARWSARKANRQTENQNGQEENLIRRAKRTKEALH